MNKGDELLAVILLLSMGFLIAQTVIAKEDSTGMINESMSSSCNSTDLVSFVEGAVAYALKNGRDMAQKEFSNKTGSFVRGDLYIYAYDFNGTNIAHPMKPDWIGKNLMNLTDSNGLKSFQNMNNVLKKENGFGYFLFPNPVHDNRDEVKIGYGMRVDDEWWLGSGLYLSDIPAYFDENEIDGLVAFLEEALQFVRTNGKQKSLSIFNDPKGNFTNEGRYIFAFDYEGRILAQPYQPELIDANCIDAQDSNGVHFIQQAIDAARIGNGLLYYMNPDPSKNMTPSFKLSLIVNVDGSWFLGSGIYARDEAQVRK